MKRIYSAGGIVIKTNKDGPCILVTQHSGHKGWDFPKGHIESGESSQAAALREVEEETGVKAEIIEKVGETKYFYSEPSFAKASKGEEKVFKTVIFFLMKYASEGKATTAFEVSGMEWLPVEEVEEKLTFKDTKELWKNVRSKIERLKTND